jgi:hypothetical protein
MVASPETVIDRRHVSNIMFRFILILSILPIAAAMLARWWFGLRVLAGEGRRSCRCDLSRWTPAPGDTAVIHRAEKSAAEFGDELRTKALAKWHEEEPKAAAARENSRRFGLAVPPLSAVIAAFALLAGRVPLMGAVAIVFAASAIAAAFGLLSLPAELRAIARHARVMRERKCFPTDDDEETVIRCAIAHAWNESLPPILRWLQR